MTTTRMEAFSDGVIAILITIMVLELHAPSDVTPQALRPILPIFLAYVLSFVFLGIYWANHHHMLQLAERVNGGILWANLHLLFWLSLIPFVTAWMGEHHQASTPTALYGMVLLFSGAAYTILQRALIREQGPGSLLAAAVGRDTKGLASVAIYLVAIVFAFYHPAISQLLYFGVVLMWLVPDRRIENALRRA
ncbi:MAG TPA: TMEM175 family protein [Gemmatimonadaceae bacterium]